MQSGRHTFRLGQLMLLKTVMLTLIMSCSQEISKNKMTTETNTPAHSQVIYGEDGRLDLYQVANLSSTVLSENSRSLYSIAESTVALIRNSDLVTQNGSVLIKTSSYGNRMGLCSTERFHEQETAAFCSGSLISEDTIITAGHCITNQSDCVNTSFVFGFALKASGQKPTQVSSQEVYRCKEIVKQVLENNGADYAVIKLDRTVANHQPLKYRLSGEASVGDGLFVIGHPSGLPTKITLGGKVRSVNNSQFLVTNLDTYGGNSGSAVFNSKTGLIEGILVRGEQDFVYQNGCYVSKKCSEDSCRGEDVTRISVVRPHLPAQEEASPPVSSPTVVNEVFASKSVVAIPDNQATGASSSIVVTSATQNRSVTVNVQINHPYIGDLIVKLISSNGKSITLHSRAGGSADNIIKSYDVTALVGAAPAGTYKLIVQDLASRDVGSIQSWSINFKK